MLTAEQAKHSTVVNDLTCLATGHSSNFNATDKFDIGMYDRKSVEYSLNFFTIGIIYAVL
jgi:hypothetical protein